tara:strand:+ start:146 stop:319 length:174 start_codon:yes stop_codon:yes gene_type:complete
LQPGFGSFSLVGFSFILSLGAALPTAFKFYDSGSSECILSAISSNIPSMPMSSFADT